MLDQFVRRAWSMEVILAIAPKVLLEPNAMLTLMNVTKVRKEKLIPLIFSNQTPFSTYLCT